MRICFVGHDFHRRTRSNAFFIEILRSLGTVVELYGDPDGSPEVNDRLVRELIGSRFDRYVFWQSELIAERVLPLDLGPSFLAPMYDTIAGKDDGWWLKFVNHRFLSFSRAHHERLQRIGCETAHFQYFPDPGPAPVRTTDLELRDAFFWERRPQGMVNLATVLKRCRTLGVGHLHVHAAADRDAERVDHQASIDEGIAISVTRWFDRHADFTAAAAKPLFFFAPRPLEGIGMATLEAMARGQIVVAPDLPSTNEYVAHLCSGLLYDPAAAGDDGLPWLDADALDAMSRAARRKMVEGHRSWQRDIERLKSIVAGDGRRWSTRDDSAHFGRAIRHAAHERTLHAG